MDARRLQDDLHGFFKGEVHFDDVTRTLYATDASIFQVTPAGVVAPFDDEDVRLLVKYAHENGVSLIARGAGTGVAGESLGDGLVVDFSRRFRQISAIDNETVRVQAGATLAAVNARLAEVSRRLALDPANAGVGTVGGMLARNACGPRAIKYGRTLEQVLSLRTVLDNGEVVELRRETPLSAGEPGSHFSDIVTALGVLFEQNREFIDGVPQRTRHDRLGYNIRAVQIGQSLDIAKLLIGSEGTLALFTEATLRTIPLPIGRSMVLANFARFDSALQCVASVMATRPSACELLDRRLLGLARIGDTSAIAGFILPTAEAALLIEWEADTEAEAQREADGLADRLRGFADVLAVHSALTRQQQDTLWQIREIALPSMHAARAGVQPIPLVEDIAVPIEALRETIRRSQEILQEHETTGSFLIHAGAGQVHARPFLDLSQMEHVSRLWSIADKIHALALELGGTVSSQDGTGLARTPWVARQAGSLYPIFRQIKSIFDPKNIFNPGKIVDPDPLQLKRPLREFVARATTTVPLSLAWTAEAVTQEVNHCNGCGQCRTALPSQRMCPIFRADGTEAATPRAKANLLRHILHQAEVGTRIGSEEVRAVADLCVHCKMCAVECPSHIDVPRLMLEAKIANVAEHGMDNTDWFFARIENVLRWGHSMTLLTNFALWARPTRWLLDKFFGVSAKRRLPRLASRTFLALAKKRGWTQKPNGNRPTVVYFVDLFANYFDPQIGEAAVAVLRHNGFDVFVPPEQRGSGMESLVHGDIEGARESAKQNLRVLAEAARTGWPIVCSEPTAAVALKQDYLDLQRDDDARAVAEQAIELNAFLWRLRQEGKLRTDLQPLDFGVGHHVPCHVKALTGPIAGPELMRLIPQMRVQTIDSGCSGMAGTFGLKSANREVSLQAGEVMLREFRQPANAFGSTECSSCRMQMEDAGGKRTLHPVQYLALAYGLMPELAVRLREPIRDRMLR